MQSTLEELRRKVIAMHTFFMNFEKSSLKTMGYFPFNWISIYNLNLQNLNPQPWYPYHMPESNVFLAENRCQVHCSNALLLVLENMENLNSAKGRPNRLWHKPPHEVFFPRQISSRNTFSLLFQDCKMTQITESWKSWKLKDLQVWANECPNVLRCYISMAVKLSKSISLVLTIVSPWINFDER